MKQEFRIFATNTEGLREKYTAETWKEVEATVQSLTDIGFSDILVKTQYDRRDNSSYVPDFFEFVGFVDENVVVYQWYVES